MAERAIPQISAWPSVGTVPGAGGPSLQGARCRECGKLWFPASAICPGCRSQAIDKAALSRHGRLYAWSRLHVAARGWDAPYVIGYVDLPEGVRVFAHIAVDDPAKLRPDMDVVFRTATPVVNSEGQEVIHFVFTPAAQAGESAGPAHA